MKKRYIESQYRDWTKARSHGTSVGRIKSFISSRRDDSVSMMTSVGGLHLFPKMDCKRLFELVHSTHFALLVACIITANAIVIGIATDMELNAAFARWNGRAGSNDVEESVFLGFDALFTCLFTLELVLRIFALKQSFCFSEDWHWNVFDAVIVATALIELALARYRLDFTYIRVLRLARVVRTLRVARLIPLFGKLRALINALLSSIASLVWAMAVLVFLIFLFAIIFMQGATQYVDQDVHNHEYVQFLQEFFGSMGMTLLTLFMSVTSGLSWWDVEKVLLDIHPIYGLLFVVYIAIMVLSLLNIVTGICVNNALEMAQLDQDLMMKFELDRKAAYMESMEGIFHDLDVDASGTISFDEFISHLEREEVCALFSVLGIEVSDAISFFEALDVDGSHELEIDEFVMGCLNLRGNVRTVDVATLLRENKRLMQRIGKVSKRTDNQLQGILRQLSELRGGSRRALTPLSNGTRDAFVTDAYDDAFCDAKDMSPLVV